MTRPSYICPYCKADDSTRCEKLMPEDAKPYSQADLDEARKVGCRVAFYIDLRR